MQNSTISQMKMLLTRIGENSKLVITGDLEQNDLSGKNGLDDFVNNLDRKRMGVVINPPKPIKIILLLKIKTKNTLKMIFIIKVNLFLVLKINLFI